MEKFGYICPECGKGTIKETTVINCQTKINNYPFIVPKAIVGVCDSCGAKNFDPQERERWVNLYNSGLEAKRVFLKAEQILHIRKKLGLNMEDFASLIGCTRQSIYNWEKKNRRIAQSRMADVIIKLLDECLNKGKVDVLSFLAQELKHLGVEIKKKVSKRVSR
jgi:DNA-binding transcriptional regulator YiaG